MNDKNSVNTGFKNLIDGLQSILETSFPLCKNDDVFVSDSAAKINNVAFELKRIATSIKNQIND